jgi:lipopolysaccharide transport system permease protein
VATAAVAAGAVGIKPTWMLVPLLWLFEILAMFGVTCFLATLGAWMRDIREIVSILGNIGLYVAPILLLPATISSLPSAAQWLIAINPFSHMVWCYHDAVVLGRIEHPISWFVFPITAIAALVGGTIVLARARANIAEVV